MPAYLWRCWWYMFSLVQVCLIITIKLCGFSPQFWAPSGLSSTANNNPFMLAANSTPGCPERATVRWHSSIPMLWHMVWNSWWWVIYSNRCGRSPLPCICYALSCISTAAATTASSFPDLCSRTTLLLTGLKVRNFPKPALSCYVFVCTPCFVL